MLTPPARLRSVGRAVIVASVLAGCSVQTSQLLTLARDGAGGAGGATPLDPDVVTTPLDPALVAIIDERPLGGASLAGGTVGGGDYASAFAAHRIYQVDTVEGIQRRLGGSEPAIVLIAAGDYALTGTEERSTCEQACDPTTPLASQTIISGYCADTDSISVSTFDYTSLVVGANKTVIGLGAGARFTNVEVDVSNGSNVILRNLSIRDVSPGVAQFGYGVRIWPGDHVWLDHLTVGNVGHAYVRIASDYDGDTQVVTTETGYITITNSYFDGHVDGLCGQRSPLVVGTLRDPALTLAGNWFDGSNYQNPGLFGPGTWAHLFNNLFTDIDGGTVGATCGAQGILQGNVFEGASGAVYLSDSGQPTWTFCATGLYGTVYFPENTGDEEENLLDASSTTSLAGQPTDGTGMTVPVRTSGNRFQVSVPTTSGTTESYTYVLAADPNDVPDQVRANAGAGKLF